MSPLRQQVSVLVLIFDWKQLLIKVISHVRYMFGMSTFFFFKGTFIVCFFLNRKKKCLSFEKLQKLYTTFSISLYKAKLIILVNLKERKRIRFTNLLSESWVKNGKTFFDCMLF